MTKKSHYCRGCSKLICKGNAIDIEIVCHRCKSLNKIVYIDQASLLTAYMGGLTVAATTE